MDLMRLNKAVDKKLKRLAAGAGEIIEEGTYRGAVYTIYYDEKGQIVWEAATKHGFGSSKEDARQKSKKAIDDFEASK